MQNIQPPKSEAKTDVPRWMLETRGNFTVKLAWQYIRHKEEENKIYKWIWTPGVPYKMTFICGDYGNLKFQWMTGSKNRGTPIERSDNAVMED
ncbi:hypothetical protein H5410_043093 [Solanum commersonii]|uniref:Uncharacterized protein n=1 Tax=Solanum commersonii TaxID=4109 RepID=A0A9J5XW82_SOLCO|nr:hypothetical protein H5410_043093 [Solanum commersonii]